LRIPPFPRHRARALCVSGDSPTDLAEMAAQLVTARVGGAFWDPATDPWAGRGDPQDIALAAALREGGERAIAAAATITAGWQAIDPFSGAPLGWPEAIALLGEWRRLIEANRVVAAIYGVAWWKRATLDALLWDGQGPVRYAARARAVRAGEAALVWAARTPRPLRDRLAKRGAIVGEIEDGFIRSAGLGAQCVPPLSVVVDRLGAHIDPARTSSLEGLLATAQFSPPLLARAAGLRATLVAGGVGKYGASAAAAPPTPPDSRAQVLVCGQVEDDRSVLLGGAGMTNAALLARARAMHPEAAVVWRPHPDVEAGHRRGAVAPAVVAACADRVERHAPIAALLAASETVHVISSLAGFEALLRGRRVVVHGLPFYAGWGLTEDLAEPPPGFAARRVRRLTLDQLVAGVLILYPRYLDPVSRLPCPPEVLIARLAAGEADMTTPLVRARMALGWLRARLRG